MRSRGVPTNDQCPANLLREQLGHFDPLDQPFRIRHNTTDVASPSVLHAGRTKALWTHPTNFGSTRNQHAQHSLAIGTLVNIRDDNARREPGRRRYTANDQVQVHNRNNIAAMVDEPDEPGPSARKRGYL